MLAAQDRFEIHVCEYEPMPLSAYSLEARLNCDPQGGARDDSLLPAGNPA
jgi:hypothetical protein